MRRNKQTQRNAYADCLDYLSSDAEKRGLDRIASTLKEARRKLDDAVTKSRPMTINSTNENRHAQPESRQ